MSAEAATAIVPETVANASDVRSYTSSELSKRVAAYGSYALPNLLLMQENAEEEWQACKDQATKHPGMVDRDLLQSMLNHELDYLAAEHLIRERFSGLGDRAAVYTQMAKYARNATADIPAEEDRMIGGRHTLKELFADTVKYCESLAQVHERMEEAVSSQSLRPLFLDQPPTLVSLKLLNLATQQAQDRSQRDDNHDSLREEYYAYLQAGMLAEVDPGRGSYILPAASQKARKYAAGKWQYDVLATIMDALHEDERRQLLERGQALDAREPDAMTRMAGVVERIERRLNDQDNRMVLVQHEMDRLKGAEDDAENTRKAAAMPNKYEMLAYAAALGLGSLAGAHVGAFEDARLHPDIADQSTVGGTAKAFKDDALATGGKPIEGFFRAMAVHPAGAIGGGVSALLFCSMLYLTTRQLLPRMKENREIKRQMGHSRHVVGVLTGTNENDNAPAAPGSEVQPAEPGRGVDHASTRIEEHQTVA